MYGVPSTLPVDSFVGQEFNQISLGRFQIQFHVSGVGSIFVEGRWELRDTLGTLIDADKEHADRDAFRLHRIIDVPVLRVSVDPPQSFSLFFENGWSLTIFDDSPQYESFSIHIDGQPSATLCGINAREICPSYGHQRTYPKKLGTRAPTS